jgi:hypothetical protein
VCEAMPGGRTAFRGEGSAGPGHATCWSQGGRAHHARSQDGCSSHLPGTPWSGWNQVAGTSGGLMPERGDAEAARAGGHDPVCPMVVRVHTLLFVLDSSPNSSIGGNLAHHGQWWTHHRSHLNAILEPRAALVNSHHASVNIIWVVVTLAHHLFEQMHVPLAPYCIVCKDCLIFLIILANVRRWLMRWFMLFSIPIMRKINLILLYLYYYYFDFRIGCQQD